RIDTCVVVLCRTAADQRRAGSAVCPVVRIPEYRVTHKRWPVAAGGSRAGAMSGGPMDTTQLLKGVLDAAVLAVLAEADGYGYDVVRRLRAAGLDAVGDASVYGTLRRLYAAGA